MLKCENVDNAAKLFSALGSETRLCILRELSDRPLCVGALALRLDLTQSAISQHLTILRNAGFVEADKRGSFVHYGLARDVSDRCRAALDDILHDSGRKEHKDDV